MASLGLYDDTARASSAVVLPRYSTSFSWASRLFDARTRGHIANIYALVRIADEIVDGPAEAAGTSLTVRRAMLDDLEHETDRAMTTLFSPNLIVHAFAHTARETGFGMELCRPFFASMRSDLYGAPETERETTDYIYGSAEVVALMCLASFDTVARTDNDRARLRGGAMRLGSSFQKINFLRDIADDETLLGRDYVGSRGTLTNAHKERYIAEIRSDLRVADDALSLLAPRSRPAVWASRTLFGTLADRIEKANIDDLYHHRIRVPAPVKARILGRALFMRAGL